MTAANTDREVDRLVEVLGLLAERFELQPAVEKVALR